MNPQDDPKQRGLQEGVAFQPDDPSGVSFGVQLEDADDVAEQAFGVFFGEKVRMEDARELALLDAEVIDAGSQEDEPELDEDGTTLSRSELEQAKIGSGVQEGEWMS